MFTQCRARVSVSGSLTGGLRTLRPRCLFFSDGPYRFRDLHDDVSHRFLSRAEPSARGKRRAHLVEFFECHAMHSRDEKASAEQGALFIAPYAPVGTLDPITSGWVNRQPSSPEYRRSASSSRPSCSVRSVETRCTYRTSRRRASTAAETDCLVAHLQTLLDAGNTVVAAELDMRVIAVADHVIDLEPGAGDASGTVVAAGAPAHVADKGVGASAGYLTAALQAATTATPS